MLLGFALDYLDLILGIKQVETISTTHFTEAHYEPKPWHAWHRRLESALCALEWKLQGAGWHPAIRDMVSISTSHVAWDLVGVKPSLTIDLTVPQADGGKWKYCTYCGGFLDNGLPQRCESCDKLD